MHTHCPHISAMHTHRPIHSLTSHWCENSTSSHRVSEGQTMTSLEERDSFPGLKLEKGFVVDAQTQLALESVCDTV